ncbi:polyketide cyclase [Arthrobacter sp. ERGS1:01]|uniref:SRPBCC family protein n=1 Tax=Arthrobacter sp. ERGS1:01 TaxID=1704044 RepID=UPI0006B47F2B|nr:SRPBCC family protein [Arthrobacter sp. ERGS1:01]ALE06759.1 polyketide cyclase [Arthrobacter sp. ERGS1:01]
MTDHSVVHATFTLERNYPVPPARVFAAWSDPVAKMRWFAGPDSGHELDFRVGGREVNHGDHDGVRMEFESFYRSIVEDERIVFSSTMTADGDVTTVSMTTIELVANGDGTTLTLTEQDAFLDGHELPEWRERGTGDWLDSLGEELAVPAIP